MCRGGAGGGDQGVLHMGCGGGWGVWAVEVLANVSMKIIIILDFGRGAKCSSDKDLMCMGRDLGVGDVVC